MTKTLTARFDLRYRNPLASAIIEDANRVAAFLGAQPETYKPILDAMRRASLYGQVAWMVGSSNQELMLQGAELDAMFGARHSGASWSAVMATAARLIYLTDENDPVVEKRAE